MFFIAYARHLLRRDPNFEFEFLCEPPYHEQVKSMLWSFEGRYRIGHVNERTDATVSTWIGDDDFVFKHPDRHNYVQTYQDWFARLSAKIGVENPIKGPEDLLMEVEKTDADQGIYDYLIINSNAQSSQWPETGELFDSLIKHLIARGYHVAKTHPSNSVAHFCTLEAGFNIQQLINFAPNCKRVVGVNNAPMVATLNRESVLQKRTHAWCVCDHWTFYTYDAKRFAHARSPNELATYMEIC